MCWAKKCCFVVPVEIACLLIGFGNFVIAALVTTVATTLIILDKNYQRHQRDGRHYLQTVFDFDINVTVLDSIITSAVIIGILWMMMTVCLIVGIKKNIPGLVLTYFIGGVVLVIMGFLSVLLELVNYTWAWYLIAMVEVILCMINIHFLVVVHTAYELMSRGKVFGINRDLSDEECILETDTRE